MPINEGLSTVEALRRLEKFGPNEIVERAGVTSWQIFVSQFKSPLVMLLLAGAGLAIAMGDWLDGAAIMIIVVLNSVLGFFQEYKAEKAIAALKKIVVSRVRVRRGGVEMEVESRKLVPGDIIVLQEGDKVSADAIILEEYGLEADESSLTGESVPVEKEVKEQDETIEERNQVFLGTVISRGRCVAEVVKTGMETKFGQIAEGLAEMKEEDTPLQKKLARLGRQLGVFALVAAGAVLVIGYFHDEPLWDMVLVGISLAVAAVPEGLPAVVTIALAVGMQRMARQRAILRKLASIEALGGATVIATDKTGTLTKNEMRVVKIWIEGNNYVEGDKILGTDKQIFSKLLTTGVLCNNASLVYKHDHGTYNILGDSTEGSLLLLASDYKVSPEKVRGHGVLEAEYAFDPEVKTMSVVWKDGSGRHLFSKGAPESILRISDYEINKGMVRHLSEEKRKQIEEAFRLYAEEGLRVIAFGFRSLQSSKLEREKAESGLTFLGFVGIADPPRPEVKEAIALAERAGVRTIMITGDNELTANAIATQIGLIQEDEEVVTGKQFDEMSDDEVRQRLDRIRIFARTTPNQKLRIVQLLQTKGNVVAVTGDGVNDALALKQADVGVAMGITGTDVAKEAADMILTDDNYATLVNAIEEGRTIFDNIRSSVRFLVGCNIGEVLAVLGGSLIGFPIILTPLQILYVNLVTDGLPALSLAMTPKRGNVMNKQPRSMKGVFNKGDIWWFMEIGLLTAVMTLGAFAFGMREGNLQIARAMAFTAVILVQHFVFLDGWVRGETVFQSWRRYKNWLFLAAFFLPILVQPMILYVPRIASVFKLEGMSVLSLVLILAASTTAVWVSEARKYLQHKNVA